MHQATLSPWSRLFLAMAATAAFPAVAHAQAQAALKHNIIIFVADGLRHEAVDPANTPTMAALRKNGVDFINSHALFPTVTTPNASAIATGHYLGDAGIFGNKMFMGFDDGDAIWKSLHDMENNADVLDVNAHYAGRLTGEESLISLTRKAGYNTAIVGKLGPAIVMDAALLNPNVTAQNIGTVFIDDGTGRFISAGKPASPPLRTDIASKIAHDPYFIKEYFDNEAPEGTPPTELRGNNGNAGTRVANVRQQKYLADTVTRAILPTFAAPAGNKKPFVMVYWSRDPDGTQHNAGDSLGSIVPGINSETVRKAFRNADDNLKQIMDYLAVTPDPNDPSKKLSDTTNIFITSDHGFGTVSRKQLDFQNTRWDTFATHDRYRDGTSSFSPPGYVSIDLAHDLNLDLYDPTSVDRKKSSSSKTVYRKILLEDTADADAEWLPDSAGLFGGGTVTKGGATDAKFVTVPSGVCVAVYFLALLGKLDGTPETTELAKKIAASFASKPYASGIWVDTDRFGEIPGALSLRDINFKGVSRIQAPAMMLGLRTFSSDPQRPYMTGVQLAENDNPQGFGTHGSFGRHDTYNCMMAIGPDFKKSFTDADPVSNADIAVTLAKTLNIDLPSFGKGKLHGRVITEALANGPPPKGTTQLRKESKPAPTGEITVMLQQIYKDEAGNEYQYFDVGGFIGRAVGLDK